MPVAAGASFVPGNAVVLFVARQYHVDAARNYDVSPDAKRFLFVKNLTTTHRPSMVFVSNWVQEVGAKIAAK